MSVATTTPTGGPPTAITAAPAQRVLAVEFRSRDGRHWRTIGGGATITAAIADALEGCPSDATWDAVDWTDLYGE